MAWENDTYEDTLNEFIEVQRTVEATDGCKWRQKRPMLDEEDWKVQDALNRLRTQFLARFVRERGATTTAVAECALRVVITEIARGNEPYDVLVEVRRRIIDNEPDAAALITFEHV